MQAKIYELMLDARPSPAHPNYWEWQGAEMIVLVRATSESQARERAEALLRLTDWEHIQIESCEPVETHELQPVSAERTLALSAAVNWGFGLIVAVWPPGGDSSAPSEAPPAK